MEFIRVDYISQRTFRNSLGLLAFAQPLIGRPQAASLGVGIAISICQVRLSELTATTGKPIISGSATS